MNAGTGTGGVRDDPGADEPAGLLEGHLMPLAELARRSAKELAEGVATYAEWAEATLRDGGTLLYCGNGGSASTAEHVAAEYVVRFRRKRRSLPALALTANSAAVTAAANDYAYDEVFVRALEGLASPADLLVLHSTSGTSANVLRAAEAARERGIRTVGLTASGGGSLGDAVDLALVVPTDVTARAQEIHLALEHAVADRVDAAFSDSGDSD